MVKAFVLVNTNLGAEHEVEALLKTVKGIKGIWQVYGVYDLVIEVEADTPADLKNIIFAKVRTLKDVRSTLTLSEVAPS